MIGTFNQSPSSKRPVFVLVIVLVSLFSLAGITGLFNVSLDTSTNITAESYYTKTKELGKYVPSRVTSYTDCSNMEGVLAHLQASATTEICLPMDEFKTLHPCCILGDAQQMLPEPLQYTQADTYSSPLPNSNSKVIAKKRVPTPTPGYTALQAKESPQYKFSKIVHRLEVIILTNSLNKDYIPTAMNTWAYGLPNVRVINTDVSATSSFLSYFSKHVLEAKDSIVEQAYLYALSEISTANDKIADFTLVVQDNTYVNIYQVLEQITALNPACNVVVSNTNAGQWTESLDTGSIQSGFLFTKSSFSHIQQLRNSICPYKLSMEYTLTSCLLSMKTQFVYNNLFDTTVFNRNTASPKQLFTTLQYTTIPVQSVQDMYFVHSYIASKLILDKNYKDERTNVLVYNIHNVHNSFLLNYFSMEFDRVPTSEQYSSAVPHKVVLDKSQTPSQVAELLAKHPLTPKVMLPYHRQQVGTLTTNAKVGYARLGMEFPPDVKH